MNRTIQVISGGLKPAKPKDPIYLRAMARIGLSLDYTPELSGNKDRLKKLIYLGVKHITRNRVESENDSFEQAQSRFRFTSFIFELMELLTPEEFMQVFPIGKDYDGNKSGAKDYFYTVEKMQNYEKDKPIGKKILDFLWDYHNWDICILQVENMCTLSAMMRFQGEDGLIEGFFHKNVVPTYTLNEKTGILHNQLTYESVKVRKARKKVPKYFKTIDGIENQRRI